VGILVKKDALLAEIPTFSGYFGENIKIFQRGGLLKEAKSYLVLSNFSYLRANRYFRPLLEGSTIIRKPASTQFLHS
jgi:hypothetical protein